MPENRHNPQDVGDVTQFDKQFCCETKDELIDAMADKWDAMNEENFDPHAIDTYLDALNKNAPIAIDTEASLAAFREKHARLLEQTAPVVMPLDARPMIRNKKYSLSLRLFAAILIVMFACAMTAQALGVDVIGTIARWTGQVFHFSSPMQTEDAEETERTSESEYADLHEALRAHGVTEMVKTNWNPIDFKQTGVQVIPTRDSIKIFATYQNDNKKITFSIWQYESSDKVNGGSFEKDEQYVKIYEARGIEHYIMSNNDQVSIAWISGNLVCSLSGDILVEQAEMIIDSIYER